MEYLIFIIIYLILGVIFDQGYKIATKSLTNSGALTVLSEFIGAISVLCAIPFFEIKFPTDIKVYILLGLSIIFYTIVDRLNTVVRSGMETSTFSVIRQLSTVFMIFSGIIFLKEPFILSKFIGAILIVISNILVFYKRGEGKYDKYLILGIVANILYTVALFLDVNISENFTLPIYASLTLGIPSILIFIFERIKFKELKKEFENGNKKAIIITGIAWSFSIVAILKAYQLGSASIVAPLASLTVILNVIVGYFLSKEKDNIPKKIISAILVILGIILIQI